MSKRTPLKKGETGYAYVFLSDPGIVLKIRASVTDYSWQGRRLELRMKSKSIAVARYSGARNMVYFPGVNKTRPLYQFSCYFDNSSSQHLSVYVDGVESLHNPNISMDFDSNVSTLSLLRHMRMPLPVSINVGWTAADYQTKQSKYSCRLDCVEGGRQTNYRKQTEVDKILESLL